jgi:uncharacterized protein with PIN domain
MGKKKKQQQKQSKRASQLATPNNSNKQQSNKSSHYQRKQERYLQKKQSQREREVPKKLSKVELNAWKRQLEPLVAEANTRIEMIQAAGYVSYALDRVMKEGNADYFDLSSVNTREQLIKEMTRIRVFMNDKGSTLDGARLETAQIQASEYKGKFGNEFNNKENEFSRFDIKSINKDAASRAFESYRKIESHRAAEIVGDGAYGSENLIIALYDAEIRGNDSLIYGEDLLDTYIKTSTDSWKKATEDSNMITGITGVIEDNIAGRYLF